jgi:putative membrane protein
MSVFGALIALRHWMRLSVRERLQDERMRGDGRKDAGMVSQRPLHAG